jgi:hypothetical protein
MDSRESQIPEGARNFKAPTTEAEARVNQARALISEIEPKILAYETAKREGRTLDGQQLGDLGKLEHELAFWNDVIAKGGKEGSDELDREVYD